MKTITIFVQGLNEDITFIVGENKQDNFLVIDQGSSKDIWVHANNISSCHVLCIIPENMNKKGLSYIVKKGAMLCKQYTNKLKTLSNIEFVYAPLQYVVKTDTIGCVTVIRGKYIRV